MTSTFKPTPYSVSRVNTDYLLTHVNYECMYFDGSVDSPEVYDLMRVVYRGYYRGTVDEFASRLNPTGLRWAVVQHGAWDKVHYCSAFQENPTFLKTREIRLEDSSKIIGGIDLDTFGEDSKQLATHEYEYTGGYLLGIERGLTQDQWMNDTGILTFFVCGNEFGEWDSLPKFSIWEILKK